MNYNLFMRFGKMFPDYSHPALVESASGDAPNAETAPEQMSKPATFAEVINFVEEFYRGIEAQTSSRLFPRLGPSGLMERGHYLTLNISALHSADEDCSVCSLGEILEQNVAPKYYLSPRAAKGILRRAEKRGRALPPQLQSALETLADS